MNSQTFSVRITKEDSALETLRRSWATPVYSDEDGISPMGSLHEAGNALIAVAQLRDNGTTFLGSGVMVGPGLMLTATHVLDEFPADGSGPAFLTFLPGAARVWLPYDFSNASGPSSFGEDRSVHSDLTLLSCTLNSEAHAHHPLMLVPLQIALPLVGERVWAFGFRDGELDGDIAGISPLVSSGCVTAAYPHGRGERMPASCIEVDMDTVGGMSGGPVVNAKGDLIGIVSSSLEGGPTYVTLIWDAMRLRVKSALRLFARRGTINLFTARNFGLVKIKGNVKRRRTGDVTLTMTEEEMELLIASADPKYLRSAGPDGGKPLGDDELQVFEEAWSDELDNVASVSAIEYLKDLTLASARNFMAAGGASQECLASIEAFSVEDFEGLEDSEIISARETLNASVVISYAFELLSVIWTVQISSADYRAKAFEFERHFMNIDDDGTTVTMQVLQHCYFEADLTLNTKTKEFTQIAISRAGIMHRAQLR